MRSKLNARVPALQFDFRHRNGVICAALLLLSSSPLASRWAYHHGNRFYLRSLVSGWEYWFPGSFALTAGNSGNSGLVSCMLLLDADRNTSDNTSTWFWTLNSYARKEKMSTTNSLLDRQSAQTVLIDWFWNFSNCSVAVVFGLQPPPIKLCAF